MPFHHVNGRPWARADRFRLRGLFDQALQSLFHRGSIGEGSRSEQCAELLLQFPGGVIGREHGAEPVPGPVRERVPGPQQRLSIRS